MALDENERLLVEGIKTMLTQDAELGLAMHDEDAPESKQDWRGSQYLHQQIEDMFQLRAAELTHADAICRAFNKVHSYKYIEDFTFMIALDKEMVATAVPMADRRKAVEFIPKIVEELRTESGDWLERDAGFNPALDEIKDLSQPEQEGEFEIHDRPINNRNVSKPKHGDGSPAHVDDKPPLPEDGHDAEINGEWPEEEWDD